MGANNISKRTQTVSEKSLAQYLQIQLFIAGLHNQIRKELVKNTYTIFRVYYETTLDHEVIQDS